MSLPSCFSHYCSYGICKKGKQYLRLCPIKHFMEAKHNAKAGQLKDNSENGITGEVSVEIGVCVVAGRRMEATDVHLKRARIRQLLHFCPSAHALSC